MTDADEASMRATLGHIRKIAGRIKNTNPQDWHIVMQLAERVRTLAADALKDKEANG